MLNKNSFICKDDIWGKTHDVKVMLNIIILFFDFIIFSVRSFISELIAVILSDYILADIVVLGYGCAVLKR